MRQTLLRVTAAAALAGTLAACSSNPKEEEQLAAAKPVESAPFELVTSNRGPVLTIEDVLFDFEEATLRPEADAVIRKTANYLRQNRDRVAVIEGHTDHTGDKSYNLWLSKLRAESVRDKLLANGISESRLRTGGFGETQPVATNETPAGRQANRRVEIVFEEDGQRL